jgi:hypothetical protein
MPNLHHPTPVVACAKLRASCLTDAENHSSSEQQLGAQYVCVCVCVCACVWHCERVCGVGPMQVVRDRGRGGGQLVAGRRRAGRHLQLLQVQSIVHQQHGIVRPINGALGSSSTEGRHMIVSTRSPSFQEKNRTGLQTLSQTPNA